MVAASPLVGNDDYDLSEPRYFERPIIFEVVFDWSDPKNGASRRIVLMVRSMGVRDTITVVCSLRLLSLKCNNGWNYSWSVGLGPSNERAIASPCIKTVPKSVTGKCSTLLV